MADYIVKDTELTSVANAIRTAGGTNSLLNFPNGFVSAVNNISGGGSSDFSTATVTVVNNGATASILYMPYIVTGEGEDIRATTELFLMNNDTTQVSAILCKGTGDLLFPHGDSGVVIMGSAEKIDDSYYYITGDCTITIS